MAAPAVPELPFVSLNLTRNPFGELDRDEWAQLAEVDTEPLLALLQTPKTAIQLIGSPGRGKTTHLLALDAALPQAHYVRAWSERPLIVPICPVLLLDEADALWTWQRIAAVRRAGAVVVATHVDLSVGLRLAGFAPTTLTIRGLEAHRLHSALNRRIAAFRRGPGPLPTLSPEQVDALLARCESDVRGIVEVLYEWVQGGCVGF